MKSGLSFAFLLLFLLFSAISMAQETDTVKPQNLPQPDSTAKPVAKDTLPGVVKPRVQPPKPLVDSTLKDSAIKPVADTLAPVPQTSNTALSGRIPSVDELFPVSVKYPTIYGEFVGGYMKQNERFNVTAPVKRMHALTREVAHKEWVFYFFCGLLLVVAFVNLSFHKYFVDLFRFFFNTSMRQKQLREQLSLAPLPSLLLNIIFCVSGAAFVFFVFRHYGIHTGFHPAIELLLEMGTIAAIYFGKFIFVSLMGWMFDRRQAAENYLFTVFLVNKIAGLTLIPMGMLMAYGDKNLREVVLTLTVILLSVLVLMRLTKGFLSVSGLRIGLIPYLVFVGAFDLIPALLIYKVLLGVIL